MIWVWIFFIGVYVLLILRLALGFSQYFYHYKQLKNPITAKKLKEKIRFTLVVPFRNEMDNLPRLLRHIKELNYPKDAYEVILVNDRSVDHSLEIIQEFISKHTAIPMVIIENVRRSASPKKDAITTAIAHSKHEWIVTTDADCIFHPNWLLSLSHFIVENGSKMVAGPVRIATKDQTSFLNAFEQLDFLSLMGTTIGSFGMKKPFLCNGANLAYEKEAFIAVAGFSDNDHIASGDDHFLLEKFASNYPKETHYLGSEDCIITTTPQDSWRSFYSQRVRWAAKGTGYQYWFSKFVGITVLCANVSAIFLLFFAITSIVFSIGDKTVRSGFFKPELAAIILLALISKSIVDYWLISKAAQFLNRRAYLKWFLPAFLLYPLVSCFIALHALVGGFHWKGRSYKR